MSFLRHAAYLMLNRLIGAGLGFSISVLSARMLSAAELGAVAAAVAAVALLTRLAAFGLGQSSQYYGAQEECRNQDYSIPLLYSALALACISSVAIVVAAPWVGRLMLAGNLVGQDVFSILQYGIPLGLIHFLASLYVLGKKEIREYFWLSILPMGVSVFLFLYGAFAGWGLSVVTFAWISQYVLSALLGIFMLLKRRRMRTPATKRDVVSMYEYGIKAYAVSTAAFAVTLVPVLSGNWFSNSAEVGIFSVGQTFCGALTLIYGSFGPLVFSYVGSMVASKESHLFISQVCRLTLIVFTAISFLIGLLAPYVVPLVFGNQYGESWRVVWFLLPGLIFSAVQRLLENYLYGRSKHAHMVFVHLASIGAVVCLAFFLGSRLGARGLALATSIGFFCSLILTLVISRMKDDLNPLAVIIPRVTDFLLIARQLRQSIKFAQGSK